MKEKSELIVVILFPYGEISFAKTKYYLMKKYKGDHF